MSNAYPIKMDNELSSFLFSFEKIISDLHIVVNQLEKMKGRDINV